MRFMNGNTGHRARSDTTVISRDKGFSGKNNPAVDGLEHVANRLHSAKRRADSGDYPAAIQQIRNALEAYPGRVSNNSLKRAAAGTPFSPEELSRPAIEARAVSYAAMVDEPGY